MNEEQFKDEMMVLIQNFSVLVANTSMIKDINFGIVYQDKQLSFINLDMAKKHLADKELEKIDKNLTE